MRRTRSLVLAAALPVALIGTDHTAGAAPATPATPTVSEPTVVADGLDHPRGIDVLPFGMVLVAESGRAGDTPCLPPSPGTANKAACLSTTGAITLAWQGHQVRTADGMASIGAPDGTAASGPHDLVLTRDGLRVAMGFANNPDGRPDLGPEGESLGQLVTMDLDGEQTPVGDLVAHEAAANPDGLPGFAGHWSNPYSVLPDGEDTLVVDAGGNTLLRVAPNGTVETVTVFPGRAVPGPGGGEIPMQSVPTSVVRGPDGALYVSELTGFPFPVGGARIYRLTPEGEPEVHADGFTNITDIAFDREGRLVVLEIDADGLGSGSPSGALRRLEADGSITTLIDEGLVAPTSVAVGWHGDIYLTNNGTTVGGGEVLRFTPPA